MTPVYQLSRFRFLWNLLTVPGAALRYSGGSAYDLFCRAFTWFEFLKRNHREWGRWTIRFLVDETSSIVIGFVDDSEEFTGVITVRVDSPLVWQNPWTLQAYKYCDEDRTIYKI